MDSVENVILSSIFQGIYNKFTTYSTDRYVVHTLSFIYESHTVLWRRSAFTRNYFDWIFVVTLNAYSLFFIRKEFHLNEESLLRWIFLLPNQNTIHSFLLSVYLSIFLSVDDWWAVFWYATSCFDTLAFDGFDRWGWFLWFSCFWWLFGWTQNVLICRRCSGGVGIHAEQKN